MKMKSTLTLLLSAKGITDASVFANGIEVLLNACEASQLVGRTSSRAERSDADESRNAIDVSLLEARTTVTLEMRPTTSRNKHGLHLHDTFSESCNRGG